MGFCIDCPRLLPLPAPLPAAGRGPSTDAASKQPVPEAPCLCCGSSILSPPLPPFLFAASHASRRLNLALYVAGRTVRMFVLLWQLRQRPQCPSSMPAWLRRESFADSRAPEGLHGCIAHAPPPRSGDTALVSGDAASVGCAEENACDIPSCPNRHFAQFGVGIDALRALRASGQTGTVAHPSGDMEMWKPEDAIGTTLVDAALLSTSFAAMSVALAIMPSSLPRLLRSLAQFGYATA